jgi:hypothetical protein
MYAEGVRATVNMPPMTAILECVPELSSTINPSVVKSESKPCSERGSHRSNQVSAAYHIERG